MNIFTVRVHFDLPGNFSDFSFDKIEEATAFMGRAHDLGLTAKFSRSSMHNLENSIVALQAMNEAIAKIKSETAQ